MNMRARLIAGHTSIEGGNPTNSRAEIWVDGCGIHHENMARLVSAAPDLLAALGAMLKAGPYGNEDEYNAAVDAAVAAIAKAGGGA